MGSENSCVRDNTVSMAKGVGILLMVMGHSGCPMYLLKVIYMFHIPLFFLLSGYCFKEKYISDWRTYIWRRVKGLYWPFVKWGVFFIVFHNVLCYIHINPQNALWGEHFYSGIGGNAMKMVTRIICWEPMLGGYWFLRELFLGSIIAYLTMRLMGMYRNYSWIVLVIVSILFREFDLVIFPQDIAISFLSFYAAAFVSFGYAMKNRLCSFRNSYCMIGLLFVIIVVCSVIYPRHEFFNQSSISMFPYLLTSTCGTLMVLLICKRLLGHETISRILVFCGNHSLTILTWHFLSFKLISLIMIFIYGLPVERLSDHPVIYMPPFWWVAYFLIGALCPILAFCWGDFLILKVKRIIKR